MLRRLDLRSAPLPGPARLRGLLPRAEVDVDAVVTQVRPIVEAVRERGTEAVLEFAERFDRVRPTGIRVPVQTSERRAGRARPGRARRAGGLDRAGPEGARRPAPHRRHDAGRAGRHRHRAVGAGAPGRALRARRARRLPVQRGHERRARAGGGRRASLVVWLAAAGRASAACRTRRSSPPARCSASTRCTPSGGAQAVALLAYGGTDTDGAGWSRSTWSPAPATSTSPPPSACSAG